MSSLPTQVINGTQKGTFCTGNTSFEPSLIFLRLSVRAVREPIRTQEKAHENFIIRMCVVAPRATDCDEFGHSPSSHGHNIVQHFALIGLRVSVYVFNRVFFSAGTKSCC